MRLIKARVQNYRSIKDTGEFDVEFLKTILVGPNEAGKTVVLQALQQLSRPSGTNGFDVIRDYPRSLYNDITTGKVKPENVEIVRGYFSLEEEDKKLIPNEFHNCTYVIYRKLDNKGIHYLENGPEKKKFSSIKNDLSRLLSHLDKQFEADETSTGDKPSESIKTITSTFYDSLTFNDENSAKLIKWLEDNYPLIDEDNEKEEKRYAKLITEIKFNNKINEVLSILDNRTPIFVLFNNYCNYLGRFELIGLSKTKLLPV